MYMVLLMIKCWINLYVDWNQSLAMRFLRRTNKPLKKPVYLLNKFHKLLTWLVEVAHVVISLNLQIMPQQNQIVWVLVSAIVNLIKIAKTTKTINLTQLALFVAKRATFPENSGTIPPDHSVQILLTIYKDTGDARYILQGAIATPRYPADQAMILTLSQMTTKYLTTLLIF